MQRGHRIVRRFRMNARRAGIERPAPVDDGVEHLVIDLDQRRGILGDRAALGDHHGDRHADVADFAIGEWLVVQGLPDIADRNRMRQPFAGKLSEIRRGVDGDDTGSCRAAAGSTLTMRACAWAERTKAACSTPVMARSSR